MHADRSMANLAFMINKMSYWKNHAKENPDKICADPIWNIEHFEYMDKENDRQEKCRSLNIPIDGIFYQDDYAFTAPFDAFKSWKGTVYNKYLTIAPGVFNKNDLDLFINGDFFSVEFNLVLMVRKHRTRIFWAMIRASVKLLSAHKRAVERVNHPEAKRKRMEFEIVDDDE